MNQVKQERSRCMVARQRKEHPERRRVCVGRNVFTNKKSDEALNGDLGGIAADRDLLNALYLHGIVCGNGMPGGAAGGSFVGLFFV